MLHPDTRIQFINEEIGYGIFATQLIPKGSIVYITDSLEIEIQPENYAKHNPEIKKQIEKYCYIDEFGVRIVSWDFAKYINHCCNSNTLSCAYGFDVAVRDIKKGEEITCDYGMLNVESEMPLVCNQPNCRKVLRASEFENYVAEWDQKLKSALVYFTKVDQPLLPFMEDRKMEELLLYLNDNANAHYKSISELELRPG